MESFLTKNLITTKDASEVSGYSSDYLARLARSGEIKGKLIGHSWLIDRTSLETFLDKQKDQKAMRTRELARARVEEYRSRMSQAKETLAPGVHEELISESHIGSPMSIGVAPVSLRSHLLALSTAFVVVIFGATLANAEVLPQVAGRVATVAGEIETGFAASFGTIPTEVVARFAETKTAMQTTHAHVRAESTLASANLAAPILVAPNLSPLRMALGDTHHMRAVASHTKSASLATSERINPLVVLALVQTSAEGAIALIASPSTAADALARAHLSLGMSVYAGISASLQAYRSLIDHSGEKALALGATTRDRIALAPAAISKMNLALGQAVIDMSHAAIGADVQFAYGTAAVAPKAANATVAFIGNTGATLAALTSAVPALAVNAYLRTTEVPAKVAPAIARAVFNVEYAGALRFVAVTNDVSSRYLALIEAAGNGVCVGTETAQHAASVTHALALRAPGVLEDAYLGVLGKTALALETVAHTSPVAAAAAVTAPALSTGEQVAVTTYQTIHGLFDSATNALAVLFTPAPIATIPSPVTKVAVTTATTTKTTTSSTVARIPQVVNTYPTYTTLVQGVTREYLSQSLAAERASVLATVAGMIQPVAAQGVTNMTTIQQVNMIQDLSNLIVRNGDFRGGTITGASGSFTSLSVNGVAITGGGSGSGNVGTGTVGQVPFYSAAGTTVSATSSLFIAPSGNIGIGTTSPNSLLSIQGVGEFTAATSTLSSTGGINLTNGCFAVNGVCLGSGSGGVGAGVQGQLAFYNAAGTNLTSTSTLTLTQAGNFGIGTTSPSQALSVQGNGLFSGNLSFASLTATGTATIGSLTGLIAGNNGLLYSVASSSLFGFTPANQATTISTTYPLLGGGDLSANRTFSLAFGTTTANTWGGLQTFTNGFLANASSTITSGLFSMNGGASTTNFTASGAATIGSLTGLIAGNSGTLYQVASSSLFGFVPVSNQLAKGNFLVGNDAGTAQATSSVFISSTGLFGIGTTSPSQALSVQGSGLFSGNISLASLIATGTANIGGALSAASASFTTALPVTSGGTGVATISGLLKGNGVSAFTAATPAVDYVAPSTTVNGHPLSANVSVALSELSDAVVTSPITDQILKWNGSRWINGASTAVAAAMGVNYFYTRTASDVPTYEVIQKTPDTATEVSESAVVNNNTLPVDIYMGPPSGIGGTQIDAGVWTFNTYATSSSASGTNTLNYNVYTRTSGGTETYLFSATSSSITSTSATLVQTQTVQPVYAINATDRIVVKITATTNNVSSTTISFIHSGTTHYSFISTPLVIRHNDLAGLQGGAANEEYHLSLAEYTGTGTGIFAKQTAPSFKTSLAVGGSSGGVANVFSVSTSTAGFATSTAITVDSNGNLNLLNGASLVVSGNTTHTGTLTQTGLATFTNGFLSNASSTITSGLFSMNGGASTTQLTATGSTYLATLGGSVGIGTAAPGAALHVVGAGVAFPATSGTTQTGLIERLQNSGGANAILDIGSGGGAGFWLQSTNIGNLATNYSLLLNPNGGNVGVGTTTPWAQLSINPNGITGPAFAIGSSTATKFVVTNAGTVGIGTTSPTQALDVNGSIAINGTRTIYNPSALGTFTGTLYVGNGGSSLSHTTGNEGWYNTAVGNGALFSNTTGYYNTVQGVNALLSNTTGYYNTVQGVNALLSNTTGYQNSAQGVNALLFNTTGYSNSAQGVNALYSNTTGSFNVGLGVQAGYGDGSLADNRSVIDNQMLFLGAYASRDASVASTSALSNGIAIGYNTKVFASNQAVLGNDSITTTLLKGNVGIGTTSPWAQLSINPNGITGPAFAIGSSTATKFVVTNGGNVGIGTTSPTQALDVNGSIAINGTRTIYNPSALGTFTGTLYVGNGGSSLSHTTGNEGYYNTAIGINSLFSNTTGYNNSALGYAALLSNTTGHDNSAQGYAALLSNTSGFNNSAQGNNVLYSNTTGYSNTAQGLNALYSNVNGALNTAQGASALYSNISGNFNSAQGLGSLYANTSGSYNSALGYQAGNGDGITVDQRSVIDNQMLFLGAYASRDASVASTSALSNGIAIGYNTKVFASNQAVLGNDSITTTLLKGNVGIGTTSPWAQLSINPNGITGPAFAIGSSTATKFVVTNGGRVGIGTSTPSGILTIQSTNASSSMLTLSGNAFYDGSGAGTDGVSILNYYNGINNKQILFADTANTASTTATGLRMIFVNGIGANNYAAIDAVSPVSLGSHNLVLNASGGNVGVGTTSPWAQLSINPNGITGPAFAIGSSTATKFVVTNGGNVGIGTAAPRGVLHVQEGGTNSYSYIQGGGGTNGTAFTSTDTIPIASNNGLVGYNGLALIPRSWGTAGGAADNHNVMYLGGSQTNNGAVSATLAFGNWGYFTGTGTGAGGLGNAIAQGDAVKFRFEEQDAGSEFSQKLALFTRSASNTNIQALTVLSSGNIGIGTTTPFTTLGVVGTTRLKTTTNSANAFVVENASATSTFSVSTLDDSSNIFSVASSTGASYFEITSSGNVGFGVVTPTLGPLQMASGAYVTTGGVWTNASDKNLKTNFVAQDPFAILNKIATLPVPQWNYKSEAASTTHIGPMAQDFYATFGLGGNDTSISTIDPAGVALLGIQALNTRTSFLQNAATTTVMTIDASGNIGVGTTTSNHKLTVAGDVGAIAFVNTSTRDAKTDISYVSESSSADMLNELTHLKIATYHYKIEDQSSPLRLGFIAEEAQTIAPEILSPDGKGVDLYKLATFTLAGVQTLAAKVDAQDLRLTSLENRVAKLDGGAVTIASGSPISLTTSSLASALEGFGVLIGKGIAQFNTLVFRQLVASKDADGTSSAGSVTILAGNTVAQVNNSLVKASTKVFVTFNAQITGSWWVSDKADGSFRVILSAPQTTDVSFDYFLVQTEGQMATSTPNGVGQSGTVSQSNGPDTVPPTIMLIGGNPLHINVGGTFTEPGVTIADAVDGTDPYITFVNGIEQVAAAGTIDTSTATTYLITYKATDKAGNTATAMRSVIVGNPDGTVSTGSGQSGSGSGAGTTASSTPASTDTVAPVVTLTGAAAIEVTVGGTFTDPGATATDAVDGDLTAKIVTSGTVDTATVGLYTVDYKATDAAGNTGSVSRAVSVIAAPIVAAPPATPTTPSGG